MADRAERLHFDEQVTETNFPAPRSEGICRLTLRHEKTRHSLGARSRTEDAEGTEGER